MQSETMTPAGGSSAAKKRWTKMQFITAFAQGALGKKGTEGNWSVWKTSDGVETLMYRATGEDYHRSWNRGTQREERTPMTETVAVKLPSGVIFSNANQLRYVGSSMAWGRRRQGWSAEGEEQRELVRLGSMPVPFSVFEAAKLDLTKIHMVEKAPAETVSIEVDDGYDDKLGRAKKKLENRHYVGACLLEGEGQYFLFDIDRRELINRIFNPFVVKLARPATTIADAYESLKPPKYLDAVAENLEVARQGEWFFIKRYDELPTLAPVPADLQARVDNPPDVADFGGELNGTYRHTLDGFMQECFDFARDEWEKDKLAIVDYTPREGSLQQGDARPNRVTRFVKHEGMVLVSGIVSHTGREHKDLTLEGWWEAVPNTAVGSWQVSGEID